MSDTKVSKDEIDRYLKEEGFYDGEKFKKRRRSKRRRSTRRRRDEAGNSNHHRDG